MDFVLLLIRIYALQGFGVRRPVTAIFDMYGPCNFSHPFWTTTLPGLLSKLPSGLTDDFVNQVFDEKPVPIRGGVSLEGQQTGGPDFTDPRQAYALTKIANGQLMDAIFPSRDWTGIDPAENISGDFPPTFIAHGTDDEMVPLLLSQHLFSQMKRFGVQCELREIPSEGHTFAAKMEKGSRTWQLQRLGFDFLESFVGR